MSETRPCPICDQDLNAHAEMQAGGETLFVASCGLCGRYALGVAELALARAMGDADRYNLMALLEVRALPAEADGTVVLQAHHFKKGGRAAVTA